MSLNQNLTLKQFALQHAAPLIEHAESLLLMWTVLPAICDLVSEVKPFVKFLLRSMLGFSFLYIKLAFCESQSFDSDCLVTDVDESATELSTLLDRSG